MDSSKVFQPDICFISTTNLNLNPGKRLLWAPDLVIEIRSPSTASLDLKDKKMYLHVQAFMNIGSLTHKIKMLKGLAWYRTNSNPFIESKIDSA